MPELTKFKFEPASFSYVKKHVFGKDWPVVYLLEDGKAMYVGQTVNAYRRFNEHYTSKTHPHRKDLKNAYLITDLENNLSATQDIESWLIEYVAADGKYRLLNGNAGLQNHSYYDRERYRAKFELIWGSLLGVGLAKNELLQIKNSDLFKYSPYKALTIDQTDVVRDIFDSIAAGTNMAHIVSGDPGTGKSVIAVYLMKLLKESEVTKNLNVGLVVPMTSLRKTLKKVFANVEGLKPNMVLGPADVIKNTYDLLIVDEAHRLHRRKGITNYKTFDDTNRSLGLDNSGTELDWIIRSSNSQVFLYDSMQSVRPSDIRPERFNQLNAIPYQLTSQLRIEAGEDYLEFIDKLLAVIDTPAASFGDYELKYFKDIDEMINKIKDKDALHGLSRVVAGYAWNWQTKKNSAIDYDIEIDGLKLKWNSTNVDWVNSKNAINEVGCIHTVQGYDLNYVAVIIGPEVSFDAKANKLKVDKNKYFDINGKNGIESDEELESYIINIYKTLLTRGIKGTYIHAVDKSVEAYILSCLLR